MTIIRDCRPNVAVVAMKVNAHVTRVWILVFSTLRMVGFSSASLENSGKLSSLMVTAAQMVAIKARIYRKSHG